MTSQALWGCAAHEQPDPGTMAAHPSTTSGSRSRRAAETAGKLTNSCESKSRKCHREGRNRETKIKYEVQQHLHGPSVPLIKSSTLVLYVKQTFRSFGEYFIKSTDIYLIFWSEGVNQMRKRIHDNERSKIYRGCEAPEKSKGSPGEASPGNYEKMVIKWCKSRPPWLFLEQISV